MKSGLVLIDKPAGFTSHDVVAKLRRTLGTKKIGHAGTLDPMATGLLVLGVNSGTKFLTFLTHVDKRYEAVIRLGQGSSTDDAEGELGAIADISGIDDGDILAGVATLTGKISQVPSSVSAIKVAGKRAHAMVRAGEDFELKSRDVEIFEFKVQEITRGQFIDVSVTTHVSSGTYIRALARDLGSELSVGGHLTALRRTSVGDFRVGQSNGIDDPVMIPLAEVAGTVFETVELDATQLSDVTHGRIFANPWSRGDYAAIFQGELIAVLTAEDDVRSKVVFQGAH